MLGIRPPEVDASAVIRELRRIDPELKKTFTREAKDIMKPMVDAAKRTYPDVQKGQPPLRGTANAWRNGRFPFDARKARAGVRSFVNPSAKRRTTLGVRQSYGPAVILENAGKRTQNGLGDAVAGRFGNQNRFMWRGARQTLPIVNRNIEDAVQRMIRRYNRRTR